MRKMTLERENGRIVSMPHDVGHLRLAVRCPEMTARYWSDHLPVRPRLTCGVVAMIASMALRSIDSFAWLGIALTGAWVMIAPSVGCDTSFVPPNPSSETGGASGA